MQQHVAIRIPKHHKEVSKIYSFSFKREIKLQKIVKTGNAKKS